MKTILQKLIQYPFTLLFFLLIFPAVSTFAQETMEEAMAIVRKITDPDPMRQDKLRATKTWELVTARMEVLNNAEGIVSGLFPGKTLERADAVAAARAVHSKDGEVD